MSMSLSSTDARKVCVITSYVRHSLHSFSPEFLCGFCFVVAALCCFFFIRHCGNKKLCSRFITFSCHLLIEKFGVEKDISALCAVLLTISDSRIMASSEVRLAKCWKIIFCCSWSIQMSLKNIICKTK